MNSDIFITAILSLLAGIGVFLVACSMMSSNLEAVGSGKLKALFSKASGSLLLGVGIGAVGTAAVQSSGAITVMIIGFVNAGVLTLRQAATMIYGANIGTTITGQIVALGMFGGGGAVSSSMIFSASAGIGALVSLFAKDRKIKSIGAIITGFGMLFVGLSMMSGSMEAFAEQEAIVTFLSGLKNVFLLIFFGVVLTAIIQSSSVVTSIAITMVVSGLLTLDQGIYLTMGSNIGSCVVALIAGISGGVNAKRTAAVHLLFNISGVVLFLLLAGLLHLASGGSVGMGSIFTGLFPSAPQTQLAMFHTVFNVTTVILVLPLTNVLTGITEKLFPEKEEKEEQVMRFLNSYMLQTPPVAIGQLKREIEHMAEVAMQNFFHALKIIISLDYSEIERFRKNEGRLNALNHELVPYLVKLSDKELDWRDRVYITGAYRTIADLERVGDYAENIVEYADHLRDANEHFSEVAVSEIKELRTLISVLFRDVMQAYHQADREALNKAEETEDKIDKLTDRMIDEHIRRMTEGTCSANAGAQYLELASDAERVADHLINVAHTILKR